MHSGKDTVLAHQTSSHAELSNEHAATSFMHVVRGTSLLYDYEGGRRRRQGKRWQKGKGKLQSCTLDFLLLDLNQESWCIQSIPGIPPVFSIQDAKGKNDKDKGKGGKGGKKGGTGLISCLLAVH